MDYRLKSIYEQMLIGEKKEKVTKPAKQPDNVYKLDHLHFVDGRGNELDPAQHIQNFDNIYVKASLENKTVLPSEDSEDSQEESKMKPKRFFSGNPVENKRRLDRVLTLNKNKPKIQDPSFYFTGNLNDLMLLPLKNLLKNYGYLSPAKINQGHASEGILGAALYCKFKNPEKEIDFFEDMAPVLAHVLTKKSKKIEETTNYTKRNSVQDNIRFLLILDHRTTTLLRIFCDKIIATKSFEFDEDFITKYGFDKDNLKTISSMFHVCAQYANTNSRVAERIAQVVEDNTQGLIEVESTGGDARTQDLTKVDLLTTYTVANNPDRTNLLRLSMKAGAVTQFGQVSGGAFVKYKTFFESMFGKEFFVNLQPPSTGEGTRKFYKTKEDEDFNWSEKENNWFKSFAEQTRVANWKDIEIKNFNFGDPLQWLYSQVVQQFNLKFANATPEQKINFVKQIHQGIKYHATLEADVDVDHSKVTPDVELLILNPSKGKQFAQLGFGSFFFEEMKKYTFEAKLENSTSTTKTIKLFAKPIASSEPKTLSQAYSSVSKLQKKPKEKLEGENLFFLQLRSNKANFRNRIEMGPFLKELADIQKQEQAQSQEQKQAQPSATEPKTF